MNDIERVVKLSDVEGRLIELKCALVTLDRCVTPGQLTDARRELWDRVVVLERKRDELLGE